jgi:hypothetical protein
VSPELKDWVPTGMRLATQHVLLVWVGRTPTRSSPRVPVETGSSQWGTLYDIGGNASVNGIIFDEHRTEPWKQGWIDVDITLGQSSEQTMGQSDMQGEVKRLRAENMPDGVSATLSCVLPASVWRHYVHNPVCLARPEERRTPASVVLTCSVRGAAIVAASIVW